MLDFFPEILAKYQILVGLEIITSTDYSINRNFEKKIGKIIKILAKYRFKCDIWTKKSSMSQRVATTKDSTKNYRVIGDFLKVFF